MLDAGPGRIAFTTDSYVVRPLFFPGGSIGTLAVNGTVNDLAMSGARPLALSAGFIIEEGLSMDTLERVVASMREAAEAAGVPIVTGDTKVVDRGKGDGVFINTAGVGMVDHALDIAPRSVRPGDAIVLSGDIGRHGMAIMAVREGLQFESAIESDCAPLAAPVLELIAEGLDVHGLRDITRGGLASALNEIAGAAGRQHDGGRTPGAGARGCPRRVRDPGFRPDVRGERRSIRRVRARGAGREGGGRAPAAPRQRRRLRGRVRAGGARGARRRAEPPGGHAHPRHAERRATAADLLESCAMIWSFQRHGLNLRCEIRRDADEDLYEFVVTQPDGSEQAERFDDPAAVIAHSVDVMRRLIEDGWQSSSPDAAPHG